MDSYSAIADPLDEELMAFMKESFLHCKPHYRTMDGEEIDLLPLSQKR